MRLTESGDTRSKQLLVMPTDLLSNRDPRMARRALEWIGTLKALLVLDKIVCHALPVALITVARRALSPMTRTMINGINRLQLPQSL